MILQYKLFDKSLALHLLRYKTVLKVLWKMFLDFSESKNIRKACTHVNKVLENTSKQLDLNE